jgi:SpoVK/Ycf46/Vps4 family AAA+-type ATPase
LPAYVSLNPRAPFDYLRRVLDALAKVLIFVDEADTQFGGVGAETHSTERRLTGKIQAMMSDPRLRGRVIWLLMTARIQLLSPDIRRPGRVGDLIIPVLDPDVRELRLRLQEVALRFDVWNEPVEQVDIDYAFQRDIGRILSNGEVARGDL